MTTGSPKISPPRERPQDLGHELEVMRWQLSYWALAVPRTGDDAADREAADAAYKAGRPLIDAAVEALENGRKARRLLEGPNKIGTDEERRSVRDAIHHKQEQALSPVLEAGLRRNIGLYLADPDSELPTVNLLLSWGAREPEGIGICRRCIKVFERKKLARFCPDCHARPRATSPVSVKEDAGGRMPGIPGVLPSAYLRVCAECGTMFHTRRPHAVRCGAKKCEAQRKRRSRAAPP